ncbi:MAG: hypothetical protein ACPG31_06520 [Planctomycetota bacterium]
MSKKTLTLTLGGLLLAVLIPLSLSATPLATSQEPAAEHEESGPLHDIMEELKDHMRAMRKTIADPESAVANTRHSKAMMELCMKAMKHIPEAPAGMSEVDQVKWNVDYQRKMLAICDILLQLQVAVAEKDIEQSKSLYRSMGDIKGEGHDTYDPEDE